MKSKTNLIIFITIIFVAIIVATVCIIGTRMKMRSLEEEINKYDPSVFAFFNIVNATEINEYTSKTEVEKMQEKVDGLMLNLVGDAKQKYSSIDEAFNGEVSVYESSKSVNSLRNICYILNIRKAQDKQSIIKYYRLLLEALKDNKVLQEEMGISILTYSREYLEVLYQIDEIDEYKRFFEYSDEYTYEPETWVISSGAFMNYLDFNDVEMIYFHIDTLIKYEQKYAGKIHNSYILIYQTLIWNMAHRIGDTQLEEVYFEKKAQTYDSIH